jgi:hypothetical protein
VDKDSNNLIGQGQMFVCLLDLYTRGQQLTDNAFENAYMAAFYMICGSNNVICGDNFVQDKNENPNSYQKDNPSFSKLIQTL